MNTGIYHGSDALVYVLTDTDPDVWTPIGHASSHSLEIKSELIVRRDKDSGKFPTRKLTGIDASCSIEALALYDGYSFEELLAAQLDGDTLILKLAGHTNEDWGVEEAEDDWFIQMPALVSSNSLSMKLNEDGTYTCGFDLSGELSIETVPAP